MKCLIPALACSLLGSMALGDVVREGAGERRQRLSAMELKAFDFALLADLSAWSNGSSITAGDTSGKVVLLVTWASWYSPTHQALGLAQKLADEHGSDLVVIGVHHPKRYESAVAFATSRGVSFPIAHDADGSFREALLVDQDPDFYVIDRAGQMRYADITTGSVTEAVETLVAESRLDAATLNARIDSAREQADVAFRRTGRINQEIDLRSLGEIPFTPPTSGEWEAIKDEWPELPEDNRRRRDDSEERKVTVPESLQMLPKRPATKGRAVVLYFWHPFVPRTTDPTLREMDILQKQKGRDVAIIGVLISTGERARRGEVNEMDEPDRLAEAFRNTMREYHLAHTLAYDLSGELFDTAMTGSRRGGRDRFNTRQNRRDDNARPLRAPVVILSSDSTVRWFGDSNDPRFVAALDRVLRIDPGVKARRDAEAEYIRTQRR